MMPWLSHKTRTRHGLSSNGSKMGKQHTLSRGMVTLSYVHARDMRGMEFHAATCLFLRIEARCWLQNQWITIDLLRFARLFMERRSSWIHPKSRTRMSRSRKSAPKLDARRRAATSPSRSACWQHDEGHIDVRYASAKGTHRKRTTLGNEDSANAKQEVQLSIRHWKGAHPKRGAPSSSISTPSKRSKNDLLKKQRAAGEWSTIAREDEERQSERQSKTP